MKLTKARLTLLIMAWFLTASLAVIWLASTKQHQFDPHLKLSQQLMSLSFEQDVVDALYRLPNVPKVPAIYHIKQGNCYCEFLAEAHQSSLQQWSVTNDFESMTIDLSKFPKLAKFIPSTPALIVIKEDGSLLYLGPYSRGSGCFANNGKVDSLLDDYVKTSTEKKGVVSTIIDIDASGCYCET